MNQPIAIIGEGCILPGCKTGCKTPDDLRQIIYNGQVSISGPDPDYWRINQGKVTVKPGDTDDITGKKTVTDRGGYITGFEGNVGFPGSARFRTSTQPTTSRTSSQAAIFNPEDYNLDPEFVKSLDPVFKWAFYAAKQALKDAGYLKNSPQKSNTGIIMGNLSYPSHSFNVLFEDIYLNELFPESKTKSVHPINRFMSGLPAILTGKALGLEGIAHALDAACASSLYAVKLACDRLINGSEYMMLAGGINAADSLFLHMGFTALKAISPTGQSRPFNKDADGLLPSEGCGLVLLKRLSDALKDGDNIKGVIHGIGLSNDGRSGGFLLPSVDGQKRCIQKAFKGSDIDINDISLVECHATGTRGGDAAEIDTMAELFAECKNLVISSSKANLGHLITASGAAGIIKILGCIKNGFLPATPNAFPLNDKIESSNLKVLEKAEKWDVDRKIACISNFGFGGNNAHVIIEDGKNAEEIMSKYSSEYSAAPAPQPQKDIAIVGMGLRINEIHNTSQFLEFLLTGDKPNKNAQGDSVSLNLEGLVFPPNDLKEALGQQLILLDIIKEAKKGVKIDNADTGVFIGMGTDADINRYGMKWRLEDLIQERGVKTDDNELRKWVAKAENEMVQTLKSSAVIGKMPNIPANRLNNQYDFQGQGFTVSCEELSGIRALEIAANAIRQNEISTAIVGAVDLSKEKVHEICTREIMGKDFVQPADAAVILLLKDYETAKKDGDNIFAVLPDVKDGADKSDTSFTIKNNKKSILSELGHSHAASGLLHVAAGAVLTSHRAALDSDSKKAGPLVLDQGKSLRCKIKTFSYFTDKPSKIILKADSDIQNIDFSIKNSPDIYTYSAPDKNELLACLEKDLMSPNSEDQTLGSCRLAIVSRPEEKNELRTKAIELLKNGNIKSGKNQEKIIFHEDKIKGDLAFAFTGAASAYPGMGRDLLLGFPNLALSIQDRLKNPEKITDWIYRGKKAKSLPFAQLCGSSFLSQIHADFTRKILEISPQAAMGLSSGETNSMFAFNVWEDIDALFSDIDESKLYTKYLARKFKSVRKFWKEKDDFKVNWENYIILADVEKVKELVEKEERAYLTIINSPSNCVIGGDREACARIIEKTGKNKAIDLGHDLAVHAPVALPFEKKWRKSHTRPSKNIKGIRFYSNYLDGVYETSKENVADALTGQALQTIDFPKIVNNAWDDGVRIFIEHGPRNSLSLSINEILKNKEHLAIALDVPGKSSFIQAFMAAAELWCAGVKVNLNNLKNNYSYKGEKNEINMSFPLHMNKFELPTLDLTQNKSITDKNIKPKNIKPDKSIKMDNRIRILEPAPKLAAISEIENMNFSLKAGQGSLLQNEQKPPGNEVQAKKQVSIAAHASSEYVDFIQESHKQMSLLHHEYMENQHKAHNAYMDFLNNSFNAVFGENAVVEAEMPCFVEPEAESRHFKTNTAFSVETTEAIELTKSTKLTKSTAPEKPTEPTEPIKPAKSTESTKSTVSTPSTLFTSSTPPKELIPSGPTFTKEQLEIHASDNISKIFGELFKQQDKYEVQVRMPEYPLLLCDRVTGITGEPGSMKLCTVWTETDVKEDSWYVHNGRMPAGVFIETGQADLFAISWLGIDFHNKGERAYRLLGCELVYHGSLPQVGDTLQYDIHVDSHARQGDIRIFFFHYDCRINGEVRISVRKAHAGFFTDKELAESGGVLWSPEEGNYTENPRLELPEIITKKTQFSEEDIEAYVRGDMVSCFGEEFEFTETHTRTPRTQGPKFNYKLHDNSSLEINPNFIIKIDELDINGGPAKRGYLKSISPLTGNEWYLHGHFKNDSCMPGTLMAEACLQMMAFYMVSIGLTINKDGWRFEPVSEEPYKFVCRGQVVPTTRVLSYEIFVDEIVQEPYPTLYAHVFCISDGIKAFLCERLALRLVPDWPITSMRENSYSANLKPAVEYEGFKFDEKSIMNCAIGKPSLAFGETFTHYDDIKSSPRLPGPPYLLMSRIKELHAEMGKTDGTPWLIAEYDIPENAWFFNENDAETMPYAVLMEIGLQPCGWLSTFTLRDDIKGKELVFRNLDGTAVQHREIKQSDRCIQTNTKLISVSKMPNVIIVSFDVVCSIENEPVYTMNTTFGFFDVESMKSQKGLKITKEEQNNFDLPSNFQEDLTTYPVRYFEESTARLPASKLLMLDRIVGFWEKGGKNGKGFVRAQKDVVASDWFFKAHFFQDPVQPGSLGVEALIQLIKFYMLHEEYHKDMANPAFEPVATETEAEWHYRGQVTPDKKLIVMDVEILETDKEAKTVTAEARLWVDGLKIYHIPKISLRLIEDSSAKLPEKPVNKPEKDSEKAAEKNSGKDKAKKKLLTEKLYLDSSDIVFDERSGRCANLPFNDINFDEKKGLQISPFSFNESHKAQLYESRINKNENIARLAIDLEKAIVNKFLRRVVLESPEEYFALKSRPVLYLANHQNFIEPFTFGIISNLLSKSKLKILGKDGHNKSWVGALNILGQELFQDSALTHLLTFDTKKPEELPKILEKYRTYYALDSLLIFAEGKRLETAGQKIKKISSVLMDFAIKTGMPIIPVRFAGGLPLKNNKGKVDFTYGYGPQDCYLGKAISTDELQKLNLKEKNELILDRINTLAFELDEKGLIQKDEDFENRVQNRINTMKISETGAVFIEAFMDYPDRHSESENLLNTIINKSAKEFDIDSLEYKLYKFIA